MDEDTRQAAIRLQTLATRLLRLARSRSGDHGLSSAQYSALAVLHERGPLPLVELARAELVTHPTMSRLAAGLVKRGMIERVGDPKDRRVRHLTITPEGRATYEKIGQQFGNHALAPNAVFERAKVMVSQGDIGGGMNELGRFRNDPLKQSSVAPLALLRLSTLMRSQNKPGDAVALLTECRTQHEQKLLTHTARAKATAANSKVTSQLTINPGTHVPE